MYKHPNKQVRFRDLGLIAYAEAWDLQKAHLQKIVAQKVANREREAREPTDNYLFYCEHPPVFTLGKSGDEQNLLVNEAELARRGAAFFRIERGGDVTFHGPGQIVGYPVIDLENFMTDLHLYLRTIEQSIIDTLAQYGVTGSRVDGLTGVWVDGETENPRKIAAIGIKCSRWVAMHGFAFNITTDLSFFDMIIPCGISDKAVTSLEKEIGFAPDIEEVKAKLKQELAKNFGFAYL